MLRQQTRKEQGARMRSMYLSLGMNRAACAKFLHVTERTLHNWESGQHAIPYTAYKLLRLHASYELPGKAWHGWLLHSGKLWTPEGHGLTPADVIAGARPSGPVVVSMPPVMKFSGCPGVFESSWRNCFRSSIDRS